MSLRPRGAPPLPSAAAPQRSRFALVLHAGAQTGAWMQTGERQEFFRLLSGLMDGRLHRSPGSEAFDRLMKGEMKAGDLFDVEVPARRFYKAVILPLLAGDFEDKYMTSDQGLNGKKNLFLEDVHQEITVIIASLRAEQRKRAGKGKGGGGGGQGKGRGRGGSNYGRGRGR